MRGQLREASSATSKAISSYRNELDPELEFLGQNHEAIGAEELEEEPEMSWSITVMKPLLRFLQLLCENHNSDLQVLKAVQEQQIYFWF